MLRALTQAILLIGIGVTPWFLEPPRPTAVLATARRAPPPAARVEAAVAAEIRDAGGPWRSARAGEALRLPVAFRAAEGGQLTLAHRSHRVNIGEESRGEIGLAGEVWPVRLEAGTVTVRARRGAIRTHGGGGAVDGGRYAASVRDGALVVRFREDVSVDTVAGPIARAGPGEVSVRDGHIETPAAPETRDAAPPPSPPARARPDAPPRRPSPSASPPTPARATRRRAQPPPAPRSPPREAPARPDPASAGGRRDAGPNAPASRARRPTEPPARLEVDWTSLGRPDDRGLDELKEEAPAPPER